MAHGGQSVEHLVAFALSVAHGYLAGAAAAGAAAEVAKRSCEVATCMAHLRTLGEVPPPTHACDLPPGATAADLVRQAERMILWAGQVLEPHVLALCERPHRQTEEARRLVVLMAISALLCAQSARVNIALAEYCLKRDAYELLGLDADAARARITSEACYKSAATFAARIRSCVAQERQPEPWAFRAGRVFTKLRMADAAAEVMRGRCEGRVPRSSMDAAVAHLHDLAAGLALDGKDGEAFHVLMHIERTWHPAALEALPQHWALMPAACIGTGRPLLAAVYAACCLDRGLRPDATWSVDFILSSARAHLEQAAGSGRAELTLEESEQLWDLDVAASPAMPGVPDAVRQACRRLCEAAQRMGLRMDARVQELHAPPRPPLTLQRAYVEMREVQQVHAQWVAAADRRRK